jgi:hypothetical protein
MIFGVSGESRATLMIQTASINAAIAAGRDPQKEKGRDPGWITPRQFTKSVGGNSMCHKKFGNQCRSAKWLD